MAELHERTREIAFLLRVEPDLSLVTTYVAYGQGRVEALQRQGGFPRRTGLTSGVLLTAAGRAAYARRPEVVDSLLRAGIRRRTRYSPASSRVLASALAAAREGTSVERDEHTLGWSCIAAGVRDALGRVVEVVGVLGPSGAGGRTRSACRCAARASSSRRASRHRAVRSVNRHP